MRRAAKEVVIPEELIPDDYRAEFLACRDLRHAWTAKGYCWNRRGR